MRKTLTVSLPRAMLYCRFQVLWKAFFRELGVEVIVSFSPPGIIT